MNDANFDPNTETILYNARVITMDPQRPHGDLVAIKGNRIIAVGDKDDIGQFKKAETRLIDCEGGTVIPGFNDAHCHPLAFAAGLMSVDCSPWMVKNVAEIQQRIRQRAEETREGNWIRAANYDDFHLELKRPPDRWELDQASPGHPVILVDSTAGHCVLNSLALQIAGITRDTPDISGGQIHRDSESGEPTGHISGRLPQINTAIPPLDQNELEQGMKLADQEYISQGITSLQDTSWNNGQRHWNIYQRFTGRGIISPRISMLLGIDSLNEFQSEGLTMGSGNSRLKLGGIKLALDESTGCPHPPQEDIEQSAQLAHEAGFQIAFHVSDVYMLQASLSAIHFVSGHSPNTDQRHRLEHCPICPPGLLLKVKASGAIVVTQPSFLYFLGARYWKDVLPHQTGWLWPIGSYRRWSVKVAFSSDSPFAKSNPLIGISAAATRMTESGQNLAPQEGISVLESLKLYTRWGAYAQFEETEKGSISRGKLADLIVLKGDPTQPVSEQPDDLTVVRTIIDGKIVWEI